MNKSKGHMYSWISRTWNPVGGACPIGCPYCYVHRLKARYPQIKAKYSGEPRLTGPWPHFRQGETVFACSCTDLFAMPDDIVDSVLDHCNAWPEAMYVFQSKVPWTMYDWTGRMTFPCMCGTTFETDLGTPHMRLSKIGHIRMIGINTFITIEPIMRFSSEFSSKIIAARPSFVNIGADSGGNHLPEPSKDEVLQLIADLRGEGIEVRVKPNLRRIGVEP